MMSIAMYHESHYVRVLDNPPKMLTQKLALNNINHYAL